MKTAQRAWVCAVFIFFGMLLSQAGAQQHFQPVDNTGMTCAIVVSNAVFDGGGLQNGDEIAVFDDTLCAGAVVYEGQFPLSLPGIMEVQLQGITLPGGRAGQPMSFKIWQQSSGQEKDAQAVLSSGGHFGDVLTVADTLIAGAGTSVPVRNGQLPEQTALLPNFPNPFNPSTSVQYSLSHPSTVRIRVFDCLGREIRLLTEKTLPAGSHSVEWNGRDDRGREVESGTYLFHLEAGSFRAVRKCMLIR
jgi:hypothetical protein